MDKELLMIMANADLSKIRREELNGREHIIVPSYTMPFNVVMNGGLYPKEQIEKIYNQLEGKPAPLGHPMRDGAFISASDPFAIDEYYIGAKNINVRLDEESGRVYVEKAIDVEFANSRPKGKELVDRLNLVMNGSSTEPIHTSIAVRAFKEPKQGGNYSWVANIQSIDHDAILLHESGAATPEMGVGMLVNSEDAIDVVQLIEESYRDEPSLLQRLKSFLVNESKREKPKMDEKEVKALLDGLNESIGATLKEAMDKVLARDTEREKKLEDVANSLQSLTDKFNGMLQANQDAALAEDRALVVNAYSMTEDTVKALPEASLKELADKARAAGNAFPAIAANSNGAGAQKPDYSVVPE